VSLRTLTSADSQLLFNTLIPRLHECPRECCVCHACDASLVTCD